MFVHMPILVHGLIIDLLLITSLVELFREIFDYFLERLNIKTDASGA